MVNTAPLLVLLCIQLILLLALVDKATAELTGVLLVKRSRILIGCVDILGRVLYSRLVQWAPPRRWPWLALDWCMAKLKVGASVGKENPVGLA